MIHIFSMIIIINQSNKKVGEIGEREIQKELNHINCRHNR